MENCKTSNIIKFFLRYVNKKVIIFQNLGIMDTACTGSEIPIASKGVFPFTTYQTARHFPGSNPQHLSIWKNSWRFRLQGMRR